MAVTLGFGLSGRFTREKECQSYLACSSPSLRYDRWKIDAAGLDVKRVDTNAWFHTFPDNNSGTTVKTEYYIRSSVLGGQTITELDQNGAKKVTHIYTGKGRLAEQRIINGTAGVYWRHEDIVTGSYAKIDINGQYGGHAEDSPTAVEYDPLGGMIETEAPPDESINPANLMQFKFAGDNNRAEYGCVVDGIMRDGPGACTQHLRAGSGTLNIIYEQPRSFLSSRGIHIWWNPVSGRRRPADPDTSHAYGDGGIWEVRDFRDGGEPVLIARDLLRQSPCRRMAERAGNIFRSLLARYNLPSTYKGVGGNQNTEILEKFDQEFSNHYVGARINSPFSAFRLWRSGGRGSDFAATPEDLGQADFKRMYLDGVSFKRANFNYHRARYMLPEESFDADQTHHFVGYPSMGINGQLMVATLHLDSDVAGEPSLWNNMMGTNPNSNQGGFFNDYPAPRPLGFPSVEDCQQGYCDCSGMDGEGGDYDCEIPDFDDPASSDAGDGSVVGNTCYVDGFEMDCDHASNLLDKDLAVIDNRPEFIRLKSFFGIQNQFAFLRHFADGFSGYIPLNANYIGGGRIAPFIDSRFNLNADDLGGFGLANEMVLLANANGLDTSSAAILAEIVEFGKVLQFQGQDEFWKQEARSSNPEIASRRRIDDETLDSWKSILEKLLKSKSCKAFIDKWVGGANLLEVFDLVRVQGGIAFNKLNTEDADASGIVRQTRQTIQWSAKIDLADRNEGQTAKLVGILLHELIHVSGEGRTDRQIADFMEANGVELQIPKEKRQFGDPVWIAGLNWGHELDKACKITNEMVSK